MIDETAASTTNMRKIKLDCDNEPGFIEVPDDIRQSQGNEKVCSNCKNEFIEGDSYCRYCGAKLCEEFIPINDSFDCIYGPPPIQRHHVCSNCGFTWDTVLMIDQQRHCPKCGERVSIIEEYNQ